MSSLPVGGSEPWSITEPKWLSRLYTTADDVSAHPTPSTGGLPIYLLGTPALRWCNSWVTIGSAAETMSHHGHHWCLHVHDETSLPIRARWQVVECAEENSPTGQEFVQVGLKFFEKSDAIFPWKCYFSLTFQGSPLLTAVTNKSLSLTLPPESQSSNKLGFLCLRENRECPCCSSSPSVPGGNQQNSLEFCSWPWSGSVWSDQSLLPNTVWMKEQEVGLRTCLLRSTHVVLGHVVLIKDRTD